MNGRFNTYTVTATLKQILPILQTNIKKYWFMGSMIPTALNGSLYREVHDFDIIVLTDNLPKLLQKLCDLGYTKKPLNFFRVSELLGVYVFSHPKLLDIGFFVINYDDSCYTITAGPVRVEIPFKNLIEQKYIFNQIPFNGIKASFSYRMSLLAKSNPKRKKELLLFQSLKIIPAQWPIYTFYIWGKKANWIIDLLNSILVLIGKIRTKLGFTYDPWQ